MIKRICPYCNSYNECIHYLFNCPEGTFLLPPFLASHHHISIPSRDACPMFWPSTSSTTSETGETNVLNGYPPPTSLNWRTAEFVGERHVASAVLMALRQSESLSSDIIPNNNYSLPVTRTRHCVNNAYDVFGKLDATADHAPKHQHFRFS